MSKVTSKDANNSKTSITTINASLKKEIDAAIKDAPADPIFPPTVDPDFTGLKEGFCFIHGKTTQKETFIKYATTTKCAYYKVIGTPYDKDAVALTVQYHIEKLILQARKGMLTK